MRDIIRIIIYGFFTWFVPFIIAIPFYSPDGTLLVSQQLFKSLMIVTGSVIGAILIVHLFRVNTGAFMYTGYLAGGIWLILNWVMDILILIPLSGMDLPTYFGDIGIRYCIIPVMTVMAGKIAQDASQKNHHF